MIRPSVTRRLGTRIFLCRKIKRLVRERTRRLVRSWCHLFSPLPCDNDLNRCRNNAYIFAL